MSIKMKVIVIFYVYMYGVIADDIDDCNDTGDVCVDHEQCCGGCCFYGECIDTNTYRSCYSPTDICEDHVCRDEEDCIAYIPPQCPGCEPLALCRIS